MFKIAGQLVTILALFQVGCAKSPVTRNNTPLSVDGKIARESLLVFFEELKTRKTSASENQIVTVLGSDNMLKRLTAATIHAEDDFLTMAGYRIHRLTGEFSIDLETEDKSSTFQFLGTFTDLSQKPYRIEIRDVSIACRH